jgi:hypothetical protein
LISKRNAVIGGGLTLGALVGIPAVVAQAAPTTPASTTQAPRLGYDVDTPTRAVPASRKWVTPPQFVTIGTKWTSITRAQAIGTKWTLAGTSRVYSA